MSIPMEALAPFVLYLTGVGVVLLKLYIPEVSNEWADKKVQDKAGRNNEFVSRCIIQFIAIGLVCLVGWWYIVFKYCQALYKL